MQINGRNWSRNEIEFHTGSTAQLGGVQLGELVDGASRGIRTANFSTGSGLDFCVLLDRGMDIGMASYQGLGLTWRSASGPHHPSRYEPQGKGWMRTFHGGLLVTCGLTYLGSPTTDQGEALGLHGRFSHLPASNICTDGNWDGDDYEIWVRGQMHEDTLFGDNLSLTRRISARLGESCLFIHDTVRNQGHRTSPHMILYHCNFGFPLLSKGARLISASRQVRPRDEAAATGLATQAIYGPPQDPEGYEEQVYYHSIAADENDIATVGLVNPSLGDAGGIGVYVRYRQSELPYMIQWKYLTKGSYITGIEPANCLVEGRDKEREQGRLQMLAPGEEREYHVEIGILGNRREIEQLEHSLPNV